MQHGTRMPRFSSDPQRVGILEKSRFVTNGIRAWERIQDATNIYAPSEALQ